MKILIGGEKSFRKTVPAVTQLVDLVGSNSVDVRKRDQLNAGGSESVETRQLPARSGQCQREGLNAVAEEVSSRENVVCVE